MPWAKSGMNLIIHSSDLLIVAAALAHDMARFRSELGDGRHDVAAGDKETHHVQTCKRLPWVAFTAAACR